MAALELFENFVEFAVSFAVGAVLLLWGRRLFWVFGGLAFLGVGVVLTALVIDPDASRLMLTGEGLAFDIDIDTSPLPFAVVGVISFLLGILVTLRFPKVASAVVGFAGGMFILLLIFELFAFVPPEWVRRTLFIVGGSIVAVLAIRQPAETMIILSSILGAEALIELTGINLNNPASAFIWILMVLLGIIFQASVWRKEQQKKAKELLAKTEVTPIVTASG